MLKIRLKRLGRKKKPCYKIVVMENLSKRDGKSIKEIGYYNPITKSLSIEKNELYLVLKNGAYPTNSVRHLIQNFLKEHSAK